MKILNNGYFVDTWDSSVLSKGLRSTSNTSRNSKVLEVCTGMVGYEGRLKTIPTISLSSIMADPLVEDSNFPYPQIFTFDTHIIVCNEDTVCELVDGSLTLKATVSGGELWSGVSIGDFIYLSNGTVNLVRDSSTGTYSADSAAPICSSILNFNGQIICGNIR